MSTIRIPRAKNDKVSNRGAPRRQIKTISIVLHGQILSIQHNYFENYGAICFAIFNT